jgi:hypothetical protein
MIVEPEHTSDQSNHSFGSARDGGTLAASFPHRAVTVIEQNLSLILVVADEHAIGKLVGRFVEVGIVLVVVCDHLGVLLRGADRRIVVAPASGPV